VRAVRALLGLRVDVHRHLWSRRGRPGPSPT
jgi:hypothetical protein